MTARTPIGFTPLLLLVACWAEGARLRRNSGGRPRGVAAGRLGTDAGLHVVLDHLGDGERLGFGDVAGVYRGGPQPFRQRRLVAAVHLVVTDDDTHRDRCVDEPHTDHGVGHRVPPSAVDAGAGRCGTGRHTAGTHRAVRVS